MAQKRRFPAGVQDFETIRSEGFVYVDKTEYVYKLANNYGDALFLSRPRRFGKSVLCSTLKYYFQGRKDLFEGLAIEKLEKNWTQYPVLHFDMSNCKKDDIDEIGPSLDFLLTQFEKQYDCEKGDLGFGSRLQQLVLKAHQITGERVVLIFDEYDAPVLNVIDEPEKANAIRRILDSFFGPSKSMAEHLRFVFFTGITKFAPMTIFSSVNHLMNISDSDECEGICGITAQELEDNFADDIILLGENMRQTPQEILLQLKELYGGYHFGDNLTDVYNPYSIVCCFKNQAFSSYWFDCVNSAELHKLLKTYNFKQSDLESNRVHKEDFDQSLDVTDSALSILYQNGFLTITACKKIRSMYMFGNIYTLEIPNQEVKAGLNRTLSEWKVVREE